MASTAIALWVRPRTGWDLLCFWNVGYVTLSWAAMTPAERRLARIRVRQANHRLRDQEIARIAMRARAAAEEAICARRRKTSCD